MLKLLDLQTDCRHRIISFMTLRDCLTFGACSRLCLNVISLVELKRRRKEQFLCSFPTPMKSSASGNSFPSMEKTLSELHRVLPASHSRREVVRNLCRHLEQLEENDEALVTPTEAHSSSSFETMLFQLRNGGKAHQSFAALFRESFHELQPLPLIDIQFGTTAFSQQTTSTQAASTVTSLEQYLGDVYIQFYLGNRLQTGRIPEGATASASSFADWTNFLSTELQRFLARSSFGRASGQDRKNNGYRILVYCHARLLQKCLTNSSSKHQQHEAPPFLQRIGNETNDFVVPAPLLSDLSSERDLWDLLLKARKAAPRKIAAVSNTFGPLGPSFRGRDILASTECDFQLFVRVIQQPIIVPSDEWDVVEQLIETIHSECVKSRPITVEPPFLRLVYDQWNQESSLID